MEYIKAEKDSELNYYNILEKSSFKAQLLLDFFRHEVRLDSSFWKWFAQSQQNETCGNLIRLEKKDEKIKIFYDENIMGESDLEVLLPVGPFIKMTDDWVKVREENWQELIIRFDENQVIFERLA